MLTGIIGAMESEIRDLRASLTDETVTQTAGMSFFEGRLYGRDVVLARCGIGKVHAAMCTQVLIDRFHPQLLLNIGVAGALDGRLQIGDIAVADCAVQHDVDTTALGDPPGMISGPDCVYLPVDPDASARLKECADRLGIPHISGAVATGDRFVEKLSEKEKLAACFNAVACDMEGGAIAQVAMENGVPYAAYRAISDTLHGNGLEYSQNLIPAARASARMLEAFLTD